MPFAVLNPIFVTSAFTRALEIRRKIYAMRKPRAVNIALRMCHTNNCRPRKQARRGRQFLSLDSVNSQSVYIPAESLDGPSRLALSQEDFRQSERIHQQPHPLETKDKINRTNTFQKHHVTGQIRAL